MGCMHAVDQCLQRRGLHSDGGAITRMEHAKRRSASTSLFLHRGRVLIDLIYLVVSCGFFVFKQCDGQAHKLHETAIFSL